MKLKTKKSAAKRFSCSGRGKIMRNKAGLGHLLSKKDSERKRRLSRKGKISAADKKRVRELIPYE